MTTSPNLAAEAAEIVKRLCARDLPECHFDGKNNIEPNDPCPVCGDYGDDCGAPSNCKSTYGLRKKAADLIERLVAIDAPNNTERHFFYFSRKGPPNPFASRWLMAGIIEADDIDAAKAKINKATKTMHSIDAENSFEFINVSTLEPNDSGLVAITMGEG